MTGDPRADVTLLDELEAARAAATPGPWRVAKTGGIDAGDYDTVIGGGDVDCMSHCYGGTSTLDGDNLAADAELIVAAVNALGPLLAAVRAGLALADEREADGRRLAAHPDPFEAGRGDMALITATRLRTALTAPLGHGDTEEVGRG